VRERTSGLKPRNHPKFLKKELNACKTMQETKEEVIKKEKINA
jgi:hypothetical protein